MDLPLIEVEEKGTDYAYWLLQGRSPGAWLSWARLCRAWGSPAAMLCL